MFSGSISMKETEQSHALTENSSPRSPKPSKYINISQLEFDWEQSLPANHLPLASPQRKFRTSVRNFIGNPTRESVKNYYVRPLGSYRSGSAPLITEKIEVKWKFSDEALDLERKLEISFVRNKRKKADENSQKIEQRALALFKLMFGFIELQKKDLIEFYHLINFKKVNLFCPEYKFPVMFDARGGGIACWLELHRDREIYLIFRNILEKGEYKILFQAFRILKKPEEVAYLVTYHVDGSKDVAMRKAIAQNERIQLIRFQTQNFPVLYKSFAYGADQDVLIMAKGQFSLLYFINSIIAGKRRVSDRRKLLLAMQIIHGIKVMHAAKCVNRDIKPDNLIIFGDRIKFIDLGYMCPFGFPIKSRFGSIMYCAPELFANKQVLAGPELDIWSAGCVLWLLFAECPFPWMLALEKGQPYEAGEIIDFCNDFSLDKVHPILEMIMMMLRKDPAERVGLDEVSQFLTLMLKTHTKPNEFTKAFDPIKNILQRLLLGLSFPPRLEKSQ